MALARTTAESLMSSACTIRGEAGESATDPETGEVTPVLGSVVYSGPCRVRPAGTVQDSDEAGGAELFSFDYLVSVPFFVTAVIEGHRLTVDASPDPALVGRVLEIQQVARGEHITARRLSCREVS